MNNSMGATSWQSGNNISLRVYSLQSNGTLLERCWDTDSWYTGALSNQFKATSSAGATSWLDSNGAIHIRVYAVGTNGKVMEYCWDGNGPWYTGALSNQFDGTSAPGATSWVDGSGAVHIRVYAYDSKNVQKEYCWDGNGPWYVGAYAQ